LNSVSNFTAMLVVSQAVVLLTSFKLFTFKNFIKMGVGELTLVCDDVLPGQAFEETPFVNSIALSIFVSLSFLSQ